MERKRGRKQKWLKKGKKRENGSMKGERRK